MFKLLIITLFVLGLITGEHLFLWLGVVLIMAPVIWITALCVFMLAVGIIGGMYAQKMK